MTIETIETIDTYIACCYGGDGLQPGETEVVLQRSEGGEYRWYDEGSEGEWTTRGAAIDGGCQHATASDETPDLVTTVDEIVATGYFGGADTDNILAICECAASHSEGYLLLPAGDPIAYPIGRLWTTDGYLQIREYICLPASPSVALAADTLLRSIEASGTLPDHQ